MKYLPVEWKDRLERSNEDSSVAPPRAKFFATPQNSKTKSSPSSFDYSLDGVVALNWDVETLGLFEQERILKTIKNEQEANEGFPCYVRDLDFKENEVNKIRGIMNDELRHHGLAEKYFLKYYPRLQPWQLRCYRLKETLKNKGRKF